MAAVRAIVPAALALIASFVLATAAAASAPVFPALTGRVVDDANVLSPPTREALTAKLEALESKTSRQLVVVTVPSLQGYAIEDYGYQLGRAWGIGEKGKNNGALLIVAPNERKVRVEVGYGLEGVLTDALSEVILQPRPLRYDRRRARPPDGPLATSPLAADGRPPRARRLQRRRGLVRRRRRLRELVDVEP
jgi:uncharacterized protein